MTSKKMIEMYDYDICNIKMRLDKIATFYQDEALALAVCYSASLEELQNKIRANRCFCSKVFYYCAKLIDQASNLADIEEVLIFMNLILGNKNEQYELYKDRLYHKIMLNINDYLTSDEYLVLRHLRCFTKKNRRTFMETLASKLKGIVSIQQQFFLEIYLIEEDFAMAWALISQGVNSPLIDNYRFELFENNARYYKKYILKQPQRESKIRNCILDLKESFYGRKNHSDIKLYYK